MRVGIPREIKNHEYRVGLAPAGVHELAAHGHEVIVESGAGRGIGADDAAYAAAGARIVDTAREVFERAELIVKVKEPQARERAWLRAGQVLFTYLHLAPDPSRRATCWPAASRRLPTRPSPGRATRCRCWHRCRRSPGA